MADDRLVDVDDVAYLGDTEGGAYILMKSNGDKVFVPISLVEKNQDGTFTMPEWLAMREGLV